MLRLCDAQGGKMIMSRYKDTPLIFELETCHEGSRYIRLWTYRSRILPKWFGDAYREGNRISPDVDEISVVRHFTNLSAKNYHVEVGTYPLGLLHDEVQSESQ